MSAKKTDNVGAICAGLRRTDDREVIADALTQVAAIPCSPEGLLLRTSVAEAGGLESIKTALLGSHGDVRLQCKAANAFGSLCMSEQVARDFPSTPSSSAVLDRLGDMLRSRSQWAQADAAGCLGWLVGNMAATALQELVPLVTLLMVRHTLTNDEVFVQQEREREKRATWGRDRSRSGGVGDRGGGGSYLRNGRQINSDADKSKEEVARERMDNIRVYSLVFLVKASHADPSTMAAMVEAGALPGLLRHLANGQFSQPSKKAPREEEMVFGHRDADESDHGADQSPSVLLAARLLYAFSSDPGVRASLLEAKCLPPLIRIRQRFQPPASATTTTAVRSEMEHAQPNSAHKSTALLGNDLEDSGATRKRTAQGGQETARQRGGGVIEDGQPPLEATVSLIIDQLVGRARALPRNGDARGRA